MAGLGLVVAVLVFQRAYYGDWLPNTFYLKAAFGADVARGLRYVGRFAFGEFFSLPLLLAPFALAAMRPDLIAVCALPVVWTLYVISVGGDAFEHGRFLVPMIPVLAVQVGLVIERVWGVARYRTAARVVLVLAVMMLGLHVTRARAVIAAKPVHDVSGMVATLRVIPRESLVAVLAAGVVPYYLPGHRFHDMLGKSEVRIAHGPVRSGPPGHNKWDYAYSLGEVRPDFIISYGFNGTEDEYRWHVAGWHDFYFYPALLFDERFRRDYQRVAASPDNVIWIYARKE